VATNEERRGVTGRKRASRSKSLRRSVATNEERQCDAPMLLRHGCITGPDLSLKTVNFTHILFDTHLPFLYPRVEADFIVQVDFPPYTGWGSLSKPALYNE
jgi:hypothetical protein